jgi:hypothetical protein
MKIKFIARVSLLREKDLHVNGRGERKVVIDSLEFIEGNLSKDHIHVFPKDWISTSNADEFFAIAKRGDFFEFEGETYTYTKRGGEKSVGVRLSVL